MKNNITHYEFINALSIVNEYKEQLEQYYKSIEIRVNSIHPLSGITNKSRISDNCSTKLLRRLMAIGNIYPDSIIGDLSNLSISYFSKFRNVGSKTVSELKELCFYANVTLLP